MGGLILLPGEERGPRFEGDAPLREKMLSPVVPGLLA
jgi:hypothetical protein